MKTEILEKWNYLNKKVTCLYDYFNSIVEYLTPVNNLKKQDCLSIFKKDYPNERDIEWTKKLPFLILKVEKT